MGGWYRSELREISKVVVQPQSLAKISTYQFMANVTVAGSNVRLIARIFFFRRISSKIRRRAQREVPTAKRDTILV